MKKCSYCSVPFMQMCHLAVKKKVVEVGKECENRFKVSELCTLRTTSALLLGNRFKIGMFGCSPELFYVYHNPRFSISKTWRSCLLIPHHRFPLCLQNVFPLCGCWSPFPLTLTPHNRLQLDQDIKWKAQGDIGEMLHFYFWRNFLGDWSNVFLFCYEAREKYCKGIQGSAHRRLSEVKCPTHADKIIICCRKKCIYQSFFSGVHLNWGESKHNLGPGEDFSIDGLICILQAHIFHKLNFIFILYKTQNVVVFLTLPCSVQSEYLLMH